MSNQTLQFNRLEVKYLVDRTTRSALTQDLLAFMQPDKNTRKQDGYLVRSLYYDTPDYKAFHEKLSGAATRHKLRIRAYGDDPGDPCLMRLEVKSRHLSYIYKTVVDVTPDDYREIECAFRRRLMPPQRFLQDEKLSKEFFRLQRQYHFEPKVIVQYRRQAFERKDPERVRVNFDDQLMATRNVCLFGPLQGERPILQYGASILEIKLDGRMPFWLHQLLRKYDLQNHALSKYTYAVRSQAGLSALGRVMM